MAEKTLRARLKLLYKSWSEWQQNLDFVPLQGEACVVYAPANSLVSLNEPAILIKIGDGVTTFENLPWLQAIASDVHNWAKKEALEFNDLSEDFKAALASYVGAGNEYRINKVGEVYTLQSREYDASAGTWGEWTDVAGSSIDISGKVDRELQGTNGKALIFNESDGGGAKFEHNDGTNSFIGVNDGGKDGVAGQLYAVDRATNTGARINITAKGMFYTNGKNTYRYEANDEIATKGDIAALGSALHYIGMTEAAAGETVEHALARIVAAYQESHAGYVLSEGAVAIVDSAEFIYNGETWQEFGDVSLYATKADLQAAQEALEDLIAAEQTARIAGDTELRAEINKRTLENLEGPNGTARIWNESDGGGVQFTHTDGTRSFTGVNDGGKNGVTGQLYSVDTKNGNLGTRLNMTNDGFYYTSGKSNPSYTAADELATKGDIDSALDDIIIIDGNA